MLFPNTGFIGTLFLRGIYRYEGLFLSPGRNNTVGLDQSKNSTLDLVEKGFHYLGVSVIHVRREG